MVVVGVYVTTTTGTGDGRDGVMPMIMDPPGGRRGLARSG